MKTYILTLFSLFFFSTLSAQILTNNGEAASVTNTNVFLDASTNFSTYNADNTTGKGLLFPDVDLTSFQFDLTLADGITFPSYFDGMVVYNTGTGTVNAGGADTSIKGKEVDVVPGFYYFYNPNGNSYGSIDDGVWKPFGSSASAGDKFWALDGNGGTTEVTLADAPNGDYRITAGNFVGTTDAKKLTLGTNNVARLTVGDISPKTVGSTDFDFVMEVYGKAHFTKGIVTSKSTYPDYVFDKYYTGSSNINPNYEFLNLNEVEAFIKENNHLPGVTKIDQFAKDGDNYLVDTSATAIETLEKVEELYLHVIKQQKEIEALKAEVTALKNK